MKLYLLLVASIAFGNGHIETKKYKDEPLFKFVDSNYRCTVEQFNLARDRFIKCEGTPVFRDCYAKYIAEYCERKWLK